MNSFLRMAGREKSSEVILIGNWYLDLVYFKGGSIF